MKPRGKKDLKKRSKARVKRDVRIAKRKRMGGVLRESEERYRRLFQNSPIGIGLASREGKVISANKAMQEITGYSEDELKKINLADTYENPQERMKLLDELKRRGSVINYPTRLKHKDGTSYDALLNISQIQIGGEEHLQTACIDITERKRMEDELRRSEERFRKIFQSSPIPALITSIEGPILDVNDAWARMSGYSREEAIGHSTIELGMAQDPGQRDQMVKDLLEKGRLINVELRRRTKSGELRDVLDTIELVELDGQKRILNMQVDITERRKMEAELEKHSKHLGELVEQRTRDVSESEEKYRLLVNNLTDVVFTIDLKGNFTFCSQTGEKMTGYPVQQLLSMNMKEVIAQEHLAEIQERLQARMRGEKNLPRHEFEIIRADGKRLPVEMSTTPIVREGSLVGIQGIARDITERKQVDRLREQATTTLMEDAVRRKELEMMRNQFISAVTHELRTPLVSIKGYLDLVLGGRSGSISEQVKSSLEVMKRNTDRLSRLTDDLLDIQRIESGRFQLNLEPLDLLGEIDDCVREIQPFVDERKQSLHVEVPKERLMIQADPIRLSQVFSNLLSNAVKYTPEGGTITLRVEEKEDMIQVQVSDTGIGIRKEDLSRVFEPFAAIQKPTYIKGTGLGLSIAKALVEAHGGRIWAESTGEGKGATFTFTLSKRAGGGGKIPVEEAARA